MLPTRFLFTASLLALGSTASLAQSFQELGPFGQSGDRSTVATAVSADGSVVVGFSAPITDGLTDSEAFRWVDGVGASGLGNLGNSPTNDSAAFDVSGDGLTVVGCAQLDIGATYFTWTSADGIEGFDQFDDSDCHGGLVSGDGLVLLDGIENTNGDLQVALWSASGGTMDIGHPDPEAFDLPRNIQISFDGSVVAGTVDDIVYRWTESTSWEDIGIANESSDDVVIFGMSDDGLKIAGRRFSGSLSKSYAFLWTAQVGSQDLAPIASEGSCYASGISGDGEVVVGECDSGLVIWAQGTPRLLSEVMSDAGVSAEGWQLEVVRAISRDGSVMIGTGTNPDGNEASWRFSARPPVANEPVAIESPLSLVVYPNPSSRGLPTIRIRSQPQQEVELRVTDALGRVVLRTTQPGSSGLLEFKLGDAASTPGVYLVQITSGSLVESASFIVVK